jgi:cAMP-specific phosphodiesterase 4/calcium/calmodulin-dependent 3',5'-cyclic nucleotide phosphodiesterase
MMTLEPILESAFASWETDTLTICELSNEKPLSILAFDLVERNGLIEDFSLDRLKLKQFLTEIESGYPDNQYHGRAHAASVVHVGHALLLHGGIAELTKKAAEGIEETRQSKFVMLAGLVAAAMHDFEHEGTSNDFHVKTLSERAVTYNNRSVNEQHHAAEAFRILLKPECNFLCAMPCEEFHRLRSLILDMVLATDMAEHQQILASFNEMTSSSPPSDPFVPSDAKEAVLILKMLMKCADLGHLSLNWSSHVRWVRRLQEEFFQQGDKEKELQMPVSFLMDRDKPGVSESQMGFFNFVVLPLYRSYLRAFPATSPLVSAVEDNFAKWSSVQAKVDAATSAASVAAAASA